MLRSLFGSPLAAAASSARHRVSPAPVPPRAAAPAVVEALESRQLLALAAGFESVKVLRVVTAVATSMEFAPDGRLFVADSRNGEIEVIKRNTSGTWVQNATPALKLAVDTLKERGIESIVFDPNFETNRYLYIYYTKADPANPNAEGNNAKNRLVRVRTSTSNPDVIDPASLTVLLDDIAAPGIHNGGAMRFGPDGMLYLGVGDAGTGANAQDLSNLNGKILRLDTAAFNASGDRADLVPSDNPFAGQSGRRGEIWAYGLRNPFTGNFKPGTSTFYVNDVGGSKFEEINSIQRGKNYGWPAAEGNSSNSAYTDPVYSYTHYPNGTSQPRVGAAITGGVFYDGSQFPSSYQGKYFFGDQVRKFIKVFNPATGTASDFHTNDDPILDVLDFDVAPDGTLWTLSTGGNIRRIRYVGQANRAPTADAAADKTSGLTPLTVTFNGGGSSDPDGDALTYTWAFGDGDTATGRTVTHTYDAPGTYTARLTVNDGNGGTDADTITITAGNQAPVATITGPATGSVYRGGQVINFAGTGVDAQDGTLPASAFSWEVVFHHDAHTHPFREFDGVKSGSFTVPTVGEVDANQWYRIRLTVEDAQGLTHTVTRDVDPRKSVVTLASNVPGLDLRLDGATVDAGTKFTGVEGMVRSIGAPATQTLNGKTYQFVSWSDGKAATHDITTPTDDTTYTATYREVTGGTTQVALRAAADAYVRNGSYANTNYGSSSQLVVKKGSSGWERRAYLKFNVGSLSSAALTSVKLRLWGDLHASTETNVPLALYSVADTSWTEGGLKYSNRPPGGSSPLATTRIVDQTNRWYEFDVTGYVRQQRAAGKTVVAFQLLATTVTSAYARFNADEASSNRPQLLATQTTSSAGTALSAAADALVRAGSKYAGTNYGSSGELWVKKNGSTSLNRQTYLKFNLGSVTSIASARLRLYGSLTDTRNSRVTVNVYGASNTGWTESGLTWNNKPAAGSTLRASASVSGTTDRWYEFDLTSFLKAEKAAGRNLVTLVLKSPTNTDAAAVFNSGEASGNRPQLVIT
jgi:glucose/arabinose dehydrogenase